MVNKQFQLLLLYGVCPGLIFASASNAEINSSFTSQTKNLAAYDSGIKGTTYSKVISGVLGGPTIIHPISLEFMIAPKEGSKLAFSKAIQIKSDNEGKYKIALPPGRYWVGANEKAQKPSNNFPKRSSRITEKEVYVAKDTFIEVDVYQVSTAP